MAKWTPDEDEKLKKLLAERLTSGQIAERFPNRTRCAVIGRAARKGWLLQSGASGSNSQTRPNGWQKAMAAKKKARIGPKKPQSAPVAGRRTRQAGQMARMGGPDLKTLYGAPDAPSVSVEEIFIPLEERKSLVDLEPHHCRWPIGDVQSPDFHFCGKTKVPGVSYCEFHAGRAFQPPAVKKPRVETVPVVVKEVVEA